MDGNNPNESIEQMVNRLANPRFPALRPNSGIPYYEGTTLEEANQWSLSYYKIMGDAHLGRAIWAWVAIISIIVGAIGWII